MKDVSPSRIAIFKVLAISMILGLTFAVKMMEKGEKKAEVTYDEIVNFIPSAEEIL